ncbi:MAG TPA: AraC family transcriptional regulator [Rudaea sp.]
MSAVAASISRHRRVRFAYPAPVIQLILALVPTYGTLMLADVSGVPQSAIYRWRKRAAIFGGECELADAVNHCARYEREFPEILELAKSELEKRRSGAASALASQADLKPSDVAEDDEGITSSRADTQARLRLAKSIIDERYFESLSTTVLSGIVQMSRTYFIKQFGAAFGITPHQYLISVRLAAAQRLLDSSMASIDIVARGVGFRSGADLGRAFKRRTGRYISEAHAFPGRNKTRRADAPAPGNGGRCESIQPG